MAVRNQIRELKEVKIPYVLNNFEDPGSENIEKVGEFSINNPYKVNVVHVNSDQLHVFAEDKKNYFLDRYNIGYWVWELPSFPKEWYDRFELFNEIWVPSKFAMDAISRVSPIPVL
ncbi:MAG: glycosyltransferase family 1 protein, partial [Aliifodinibius sp.]|nr:glycosyltransferase family 1 protein [Fodinibius sp.]